MLTIERYNTSTLCILCMLVPQILPITLILLHTYYEKSTPQIGGPWSKNKGPICSKLRQNEPLNETLPWILPSKAVPPKHELSFELHYFGSYHYCFPPNQCHLRETQTNSLRLTSSWSWTLIWRPLVQFTPLGESERSIPPLDLPCWVQVFGSYRKEAM